MVSAEIFAIIVTGVVSIVGAILAIRKFPGEWIKNKAEVQKMKVEAETLQAERDKLELQIELERLNVEKITAEAIHGYVIESRNTRLIIRNLEGEIFGIKKERDFMNGEILLLRLENEKSREKMKELQIENEVLRKGFSAVPEVQESVRRLDEESQALHAQVNKIEKIQTGELKAQVTRDRKRKGQSSSTS